MYTNDEVYAVKDLNSGTENDGLCFSVHAAKFGNAVLLAGSSGTDSPVKMSGMPDCLFPANPFVVAGYRHVSFEECQKYKILYF
jgi:hypothetical protein